ncbi:MAG: chorismate mutase [Firmicutes bacterium]|nr:chorismate mutase [Bacillota bacterium]MDH7495460.1 chorismate mutase [Bacillota bacterium]
MGDEVFAIRGAIAPVANTKEGVAKATGELLAAILNRNRLDVESVVFAFFTTTADLNAAFPAAAAREAGWSSVPMMCGVEIPVEGALSSCLRVLLLCRRAEAPEAQDRSAAQDRRTSQAALFTRPCLARCGNRQAARRLPADARAAVHRRTRRRARSSSPDRCAQARPVHVYLGEAAILRPDLARADTSADCETAKGDGSERIGCGSERGRKSNKADSRHMELGGRTHDRHNETKRH